MISTDKPNILSNVTKFVQEELDKENIPPDSKLAIVGTVDTTGAKILTAVKISGDEKKSLKVISVFEHDWDGDNIAAAKLVFVSK